jgi:BolA protein
MTTAQTDDQVNDQASPMANAADTSSMANTIEAKVRQALAPSHLEVINESGNHNVPKGSESHFKLVIVSEKFEGQRTLHRHRMVYGVLEQELAGSVHALALHTYTAKQWREVGDAPDSPNCHGGMKVEAEVANKA